VSVRELLFDLDDGLVEKAIEIIRFYEREALRLSPDGYYFCDSFGKDSCVVRDLMQKSGVSFTANHNFTTIDPPELIRFGREHHPETIIHKPKVAMLKRLVANGPPTRLSRWCCDEYKERGGVGAVKVFGVRTAESPRRGKQWTTWTKHRSAGWVLNPILHWSDRAVWDYIRANAIPYCSLYDEGFKRLGCIGCPMAGKGRLKEFARWPKYEAAWKLAFRRFWERWHGVPRRDGRLRWFDAKGLQSWEELWDWWMTRNPRKKNPDDECQMGLF